MTLAVGIVCDECGRVYGADPPRPEAELREKAAAAGWVGDRCRHCVFLGRPEVAKYLPPKVNYQPH